VDRNAHLRRWETVRDDRYVVRREEVAVHGTDGQDDGEAVEDRVGQPPCLIFLVMREVITERRNERAHERAVEDAEEDRWDRRRRKERIHLPTRTEVTRADDFA
jgi:hypothetical protein